METSISLSLAAKLIITLAGFYAIEVNGSARDAATIQPDQLPSTDMDSSKLGWLFEDEDDAFPAGLDETFSSVKLNDDFAPKPNSSRFSGLFSEQSEDPFVAGSENPSSGKLGELFSEEAFEPFVEEPESVFSPQSRFDLKDAVDGCVEQGSQGGGPRLAYVTMLTDDTYMPGVQALLYSLEQAISSVDQRYMDVERVCIVTPQVSKANRIWLKQIRVRVIEVSPIAKPYKHMKVDDGIGAVSGYTKLNIWKLTDYTKVIYMDADVILVDTIDELFDLDVSFAAAPDIFPPDKFNTGVMVIRPDEEIFWKMKNQTNKLPSHDHGVTGFLNSFFSDWYAMPSANRLPFRYNALRTLHWLTYNVKSGYWDSLKPFKIIHYCSSPKPWEPNEHKDPLEMLWWKIFTSAEAEWGTKT